MSKFFPFLLFLISASASAQTEQLFFDKAGKSTSENQAYYFRLRANDGSYKSTYTNTGSTYFEGKILNASSIDESENVYQGTCTWYHKNGQKKAVRNFNSAGKEEGLSVYYYESGKIWKEYEFINGRAGFSFKEFTEDGQSSKIFEDDFLNNGNDWDLYSSDKTSAAINDGFLELTSFTNEGASRYISLPIKSQEFTIEAIIDLAKLKDGDKAGLLFGFKDWSNYNFFFISQSSFYVGTVYEGVVNVRADGMFSGEIKKKEKNSIKVLTENGKNFFVINGSINYSSERTRNYGSNLGFAVSGKSSIKVDKMIFKEINFKGVTASANTQDINVKGTGSGFIFSPKGHIITNHHVIENANNIYVEFTNDGLTQRYSAILLQKDVDNDLAILKINDDSFKPLEGLNYSFKESGGVEVGSSVFTIGYPHALTGMGKEAKFTDGKISSKTGFNNSINNYQTSIPVQPGNSGGPLFNEKGQLIGVINSKVMGADNVSYAIKLNYVKNLIELLSDINEMPNNTTPESKSLEEKVKILSNYVCLIKIK